MVTRLSMLVGRARAAIAGTHEPSWRDVTAFVVVALPAALYRIRWWTVGVTVGLPRARRDRGRLGGDAARRARVDGDAEPAAGVRRELVRGVLRRPARASRRWCGPTTRS